MSINSAGPIGEQKHQVGPVPKIAFAILAHKNAKQVADLIASLRLGPNICVVHCDSKAGEGFERDIRRQLPSTVEQHLRFIDRRSITWGGRGLISTTLEAIEVLLSWRQDWGHFVNLSGQCLPTRPVRELAEFLSSKPDANYVEAVDVAREFRRALRWAGFRYVEIGGRLYFTPIPGRRLKGLQLHKGSSWVMLSRDFCRHVLEDELPRRVIASLRFAKLPEEMVFQTIIQNGPFKHTRIDDNKRFIIWPSPRSPHPEILTMRHLRRLENENCFIARKFDAAVDSQIVERLVERVSSPATCAPPSHRGMDL